MPDDRNPFGLHTVTPYLAFEGVAAIVDFVQQLFGAELRGAPQFRDDGSLAHAEVTIGDSVVMMGEPIDDMPAVPGMLYVYVDDCDATYARALELGAESVTPPRVYPHGDRYGGVRDAAGNIWWVVTHVGKEGGSHE